MTTTVQISVLPVKIELDLFSNSSFQSQESEEISNKFYHQINVKMICIIGIEIMQRPSIKVLGIFFHIKTYILINFHDIDNVCLFVL